MATGPGPDHRAPVVRHDDNKDHSKDHNKDHNKDHGNKDRDRNDHRNLTAICRNDHGRVVAIVRVPNRDVLRQIERRFDLDCRVIRVA